MDIKAVKEHYKKFLFSLPNVVALGIGPKIRKGQPTGETAIKVFVSKKVDRSELEERLIPSPISSRTYGS